MEGVEKGIVGRKEGEFIDDQTAERLSGDIDALPETRRGEEGRGGVFPKFVQ